MNQRAVDLIIGSLVEIEKNSTTLNNIIVGQRPGKALLLLRL